MQALEDFLSQFGVFNDLASDPRFQAAVVRWGIRAWENSHAWLAVVDTDGAPLREGQLEFFVYDDSPWAPSPTPSASPTKFTNLMLRFRLKMPER